MTEYLDEQPAVAEIHTLDVDGPFVEITRTKVAKLRLRKVRQVLQVSDQLEAGYSWHFFRDAARSRTRRGLLPAFAAGTATLRLAGRSPSLALPCFNLIFRKAPDGQ